ncbi:NAD-dependent epimerase/dehydratase family protein [Patescibacteria group bacterium]
MNKKTKKKVLITGGGGFIGSSLILALQNNEKIICLDRGNRYPKIKRLINNNVTLVKGEITDETLLDNLLRNCYAIIHLAGGGGNSACMKNPTWAANTHILGTHLLLKKASKYNIKKFVFTSSQFVYASLQKRTPLLKESARLEPDDFYGTLKKIAEDLIFNSKINYSVLRLANVYGNSELYPTQKSGAINNFIKSAFDKEKLKIHGSGKQEIDYMHIQDAVRAIELTFKENSQRKVYNIGSGKLVKIEEITKIINDIFKDKFKQGIKVKKVPVSSSKIQPGNLMSIRKIRRDLGWKPEISLKTGLEEIINNYSDKK